MRCSIKGLCFLLLPLALLGCRKGDIGTDTSAAEKVHRLFAFHIGFLPLLERIRYSGPGPSEQKGNAFCGKLQLLNGDTASFPENSALTYRYTPLDSCSKAGRADRSGSLRVTFYGAMDEVGSKVVLESDGFRSETLEMNGRAVIEREQDQWLFQWNRVEYQLDGSIVSVLGKMEVLRTLGGASKGVVSDDRYIFRPDFKGKGLENASYQVEYREAIERDMSCRWPWKGSLWIKPRDIGTRELNYGDAKGCSDNGKVFRIGFH